MTRCWQLGCLVWLSLALPALGCGDDASGDSPDVGGASSGDAGQAGGNDGSSSSPQPAGDGGGGDGDTMPRADAGAASADSPTCEPAAETLTPQDRVGLGEACGGATSEESLLPNLDDAFLTDLPLTTALEPGEPYAISIRPSSNTNAGSLEIWGADQGCGPVDELLWFGDMEGRSMCIELLPTRPHSRLEFVTRRLDPLSGIFSAGPGTVVLCPGGSCPGGSDGHPLAPGVVLDPPLGIYRVTCVDSPAFECTVGGTGRLVLFHDEARSDEQTDTFWPVSAGAFRLPSTDRFGDAWYCVGAGSDAEESPDGERTDLRLREVTRMPPCVEGSESASFDWTRGVRTGIAVTSSLDELAGDDFSIRQNCGLERCNFRFTGPTTTTHLYLTFDGSVSGLTAPTEVSVAEAAWFISPDGGSPVRRVCSASGTVQYDPTGSSTFQLDNLSAPLACPGEAIADDSVDIVGE